MTNKEQQNPALSLQRRAAGFILSPILRSEVISDPSEDGRKRFEQMLLDGHGGIIVLRHFSLKDPPQMVKDVVISSGVLISRKIVFPNAAHHIYPGIGKVGRFLGIKIDPVVTQNAIRHAIAKGKPEPKLSEGSLAFLHDAVDYLRRGQLVAIAPEGERRRTLEPYNTNSIGVLLAATRRAKVNAALIFVDLRIANSGQNYWDKSGFNPFAKYEVRIGRCLTGDEILSMANGRLRDVDEQVILPEMRRTAAIVNPR